MIIALTVSADLDDGAEIQNLGPHPNDISMNAIVEEFHQQFAAGEPTKIDWLADGISELDQYFSEQMLTNVNLYNQKKQEFETLVDPLSGRFYMWGIESDYSLVFISDAEFMELGEDSRHYNTESEDDDEDDVDQGW